MSFQIRSGHAKCESEYGWLKYPTAYGRAINLARRMTDEFDAIFEKYDVVITPTCPEPPRRHIPAHAGPLGWAEHAREFPQLPS